MIKVLWEDCLLCHPSYVRQDCKIQLLNCIQTKTFPQLDTTDAGTTGLTGGQKNHRATIQGT